MGESREIEDEDCHKRELMDGLLFTLYIDDMECVQYSIVWLPLGCLKSQALLFLLHISICLAIRSLLYLLYAKSPTPAAATRSAGIESCLASAA